MAYYRFTAPEYDDVLLDEGEFDSMEEVELAVDYLAEYHGCFVKSTRRLKSGQSRSAIHWIQEKLMNKSSIFASS